MDPLLTVLIAVIVLLFLLALRAPVALALLSAGLLGILLLQGTGVASGVLGSVPFSTPAAYVLAIIPMFIAMGVFAKRGTIAEDGFMLAARLLRRVPGGLALATVLGCAGFAAVSGSSVATVATLGPVATREMRAHGYDDSVAAGVVGAAGTLGVLIPPSIVLVIYGVLTRESIGMLLIAGIVPGIVSALAYGIALLVRARVAPRGMGGSAAEIAVRQVGTKVPVPSLLKIVVLFTVVVGGIYSGLVSATEAAALGAAVALLFFIGDLGRVPARERFGQVREGFGEATQLSGMAFALLIGASVFTYFLVAARVPRSFTAWITGLDLAPILVVALLLLAFVPLGMFLDPLSTMLIAVPLAYPVVTAVGFDGIWFGILVVKMIEIGLITPPFGVNAYVVAGAVPDISVGTAFRGILWFLPIDALTVVLIFFVPSIVTWLPSVMAGG